MQILLFLYEIEIILIQISVCELEISVFPIEIPAFTLKDRYIFINRDIYMYILSRDISIKWVKTQASCHIAHAGDLQNACKNIVLVLFSYFLAMFLIICCKLLLVHQKL